MGSTLQPTTSERVSTSGRRRGCPEPPSTGSWTTDESQEVSDRRRGRSRTTTRMQEALTCILATQRRKGGPSHSGVIPSTTLPLSGLRPIDISFCTADGNAGSWGCYESNREGSCPQHLLGRVPERQGAARSVLPLLSTVAEANYSTWGGGQGTSGGLDGEHGIHEVMDSIPSAPPTPAIT